MSTQAKVDAILHAVVSAENGPAGIVFGAIDRSGKMLVQSAAGVKELGKEATLGVDDVFCLYSCTKAITGIAVMQLVEQGKLDLDEPVDKLLPEIAAAQIIDEAGNLTPAHTKITLRMLLTHTSGLSYTFFNKAVGNWGAREGKSELAGEMSAFEQPLAVEPGTAFNYSIGIHWAGIALSRVSGMTVAEYFKAHIFDPLDVHSTSYEVQPHMQPRLVALHSRGLDGTLSVRARPTKPTVPGAIPFETGGSGIYSTLGDYLKIINVLINGGKGGNGARILKENTVTMMLQDQIAHLEGTMEVPIPAPNAELVYGPIHMLPGVSKGWGLTFMITKDPLPTGRSAGSVWWSGLGNLYWQADPIKGTANFLLSQSIPYHDPRILDAWRDCETAVYDSLSS